MHGVVIDEEYNHHVVISIFDTKSGKRITNTKLKSIVVLVGAKGNTKDLEPMHEVLLDYGNYFTMHQAAHYSISTETLRANTKSNPVTHFIFNRPKD